MAERRLGILGFRAVHRILGFQLVQGVPGVLAVLGIRRFRCGQGVLGVQGFLGFRVVPEVQVVRVGMGCMVVVGAPRKLVVGVQGILGLLGLRGVRGVRSFLGFLGVRGDREGSILRNQPGV